MQRIMVWLLPFFWLAGNTLPAQPLRSFPLSQVQLLDGPFLRAQQVDLQYILALDPDRLLAPFLKDAGIPLLKESYGNWENSGLDGHTAGHYVSALSAMYAATGNEECLRRLNYMLSWLDSCQQKNGNGYVGGVPGGHALWKEISEGNPNAVSKRWVPLYNIHKLYAGLYHAYTYAGSEKALGMLTKLTEWLYQLITPLTDAQIQEMLRVEHGGINEVVAQVAQITGEKKYLDLAVRLSHRALLDPLLQRKVTLEGLHANTQIPKVAGFKYIADARGDAGWSDASAFFWKTVVDQWTVSIGGNSVREHFNPPNDFSSALQLNEGPETCNTYNMLHLTEYLYLTDPQTAYMDYYEKALFNHILSSQHPGKGGFVYFTPMRPRHYRVYSQPQETFWCCVGTGMENHAKYGQMIYAHDDRSLYVNLFIASRLDWKEKGIQITQNTRFPYSDKTALTFNVTEPARLDLKIRIPEWANPAEIRLSIAKRRINDVQIANGYIVLSREWRDGDEVALEFPMHLGLDYLPDGSSWASIKYGPIVLAAISDSTGLDSLFAPGSRWGHIARGPYYPIEESPKVVSPQKDFRAKIKPINKDQLTFKMPALIYPDKYKNLVLRPFFDLHDARYIIYWPVVPEVNEKELEKLKNLEKK